MPGFSGRNVIAKKHIEMLLNLYLPRTYTKLVFVLSFCPSHQWLVCTLLYHSTRCMILFTNLTTSYWNYSTSNYRHLNNIVKALTISNEIIWRQLVEYYLHIILWPNRKHVPTTIGWNVIITNFNSCEILSRYKIWYSIWNLLKEKS